MFCNDECRQLNVEFHEYFSCLKGHELYKHIERIQYQLIKMTNVQLPDTDESIIRIQKFLTNLAVRVKYFGASRSYRKKELNALCSWVSSWLCDKVSDYKTWKRIELIRYLQAEKSAVRDSDNKADNVVSISVKNVA